MRKWFFLLLAFLMPFSMSGCWGKTEVEELGFIMAIGIDQGQAPDTYRVTYQMGVPKKGGEGGGSSIDNLTLTVEAHSMRESMDKVYSVSSRRPFVGTVKVIVVGEELARLGINPALDFFQRYYEFRRTAFLVISKGPAAQLLGVETRQDKLAGLSILGIIEQAKATSSFPVVRLGHYLTVLADEILAPVIPIAYPLKSGEAGMMYKGKEGDVAEEIRLSGAAVLKGDRLKDILSEAETRGYMWLQDEVKQRFITAKLEMGGKNSFASARILTARTKWKLEPMDGKVGIHYTITGTWDGDELSGAQQRLSPSEWLNQYESKINEAFTEVIQEECDAALQKSRELQLDFIGIGKHIQQRDPHYWKMVKDDWENRLTSFPVVVDVNLRPENEGTTIGPPTNPPGTGQE